jgi:hypothetical protein
VGVAPKLPRGVDAPLGDKPKRTTTAVRLERLKEVKARLDAAISEHHRVRGEAEALERRHPLDALRDLLRRELRRVRRSRTED